MLHKASLRLRVLCKFDKRIGLFFVLHECKDSLTNGFDDLTADRCKAGIGYRVPCIWNNVGSARICARRCETGNTGYRESASGNCGFSFKAAAEPAAS